MTVIFFDYGEPLAHQNNTKKAHSPHYTEFTAVSDNTCFQEVHKVQNSI